MIKTKNGKTNIEATTKELKADLFCIFKSLSNIFGINSTKKIINESLKYVENEITKENIKEDISKHLPVEIYEILEGLL